MAINECDIFNLKMLLEFYDNDLGLLLVKLPGTNVY